MIMAKGRFCMTNENVELCIRWNLPSCEVQLILLFVIIALFVVLDVIQLLIWIC